MRTITIIALTIILASPAMAGLIFGGDTAYYNVPKIDNLNVTINSSITIDEGEYNLSHDCWLVHQSSAMNMSWRCNMTSSTLALSTRKNTLNNYTILVQWGSTEEIPDVVVPAKRRYYSSDSPANWTAYLKPHTTTPVNVTQPSNATPAPPVQPVQPPKVEPPKPPTLSEQVNQSIEENKTFVEATKKTTNWFLWGGIAGGIIVIALILLGMYVSRNQEEEEDE